MSRSPVQPGLKIFFFQTANGSGLSRINLDTDFTSQLSANMHGGSCGLPELDEYCLAVEHHPHVQGWEP